MKKFAEFHQLRIKNKWYHIQCDYGYICSLVTILKMYIPILWSFMCGLQTLSTSLRW